MRAYVIGSSALYFWRRSALSNEPLSRVVPDPLSDCPVNSSSLSGLALDNGRFGTAPIHLMTASCDQRVGKRSFRYTVRSGILPETAFRQAERGICVASPEYCLLQSAKVYSEYRLIELAMELCGKYALVKESSRGFISRDFSLATVVTIERFVSAMKGEPGAAAVQKVLPYVRDCSRSPMETRAYLFMCLPKRMGGYGLPKPELNVRIDLSEEERLAAKRRYFECDMCWPEWKVVVEYDGHEDHSFRDDRDRDSIKRNILLAKGYTVFTITAGQISNVLAFEKVVCEIAKQLNYRLRGYPAQWESKRAKLRLDLFKSLG